MFTPFSGEDQLLILTENDGLLDKNFLKLESFKVLALFEMKILTDHQLLEIKN